MFSAPIGRLRFFILSVVTTVAEILTNVACIAATIGFAGLAESKPGSSRNDLALVVLVASLIFLLIRSNLAWRRSRDARGSKWLLGGYVVFSTCFALLQSLTLLVYKFGGDNSNPGMSLLGLALFGLWFRILFASPAAAPFDPEAFLASEGLSPRPDPRGGVGSKATASAATTPTSSGSRNRPASTLRPTGFGRRGIV